MTTKLDEKTISEVAFMPKIEFRIACPTMGDGEELVLKLTATRALELVNFLSKLAGDMKADINKTAEYFNISLA